jgi:hypothetical protein
MNFTSPRLPTRHSITSRKSMGTSTLPAMSRLSTQPLNSWSTLGRSIATLLLNKVCHMYFPPGAAMTRSRRRMSSATRKRAHTGVEAYRNVYILRQDAAYTSVFAGGAEYTHVLLSSSQPHSRNIAESAVAKLRSLILEKVSALWPLAFSSTLPETATSQR